MSRELVLRLARDGLIERWQIENALQAQLLYEGSLLSNILRLGYMEEATALNYLGKQHQIPLVREERLAEISTRILDMTPRDLVAHFRFLPLGMQSEMLVAAVNMPLNADDLAFISDFMSVKVKQVLTFEHLLLAAIMRHFAIQLPSLIKRDKPMVDFADPRKAGEDVDSSSNLYLSTPSISVLNSTLPTPVSPPPGSTNLPVEEEERKPDLSLKTLESALTQADTRDDVIKAACAWLEGHNIAAAFLSVKKTRLEGFFVAGDDERLAAFKNYTWSLENEHDPLTALVQNASVEIFERAPDAPGFEPLFESLGGKNDKPICVVPLTLKGKTVGLMLGQGDRAGLLPITTLNQAKTILATSLETVILSQKIGV